MHTTVWALQYWYGAWRNLRAPDPLVLFSPWVCREVSTQPQWRCLPAGRQQIAYIVDDDRGARASLALLLRSLEIQTRAFAAASDLLEELAYLEPGCFLLDIRMPDMSGIDLLHQLRERNCWWPAIMVTGHGDISQAVQSVKLGAVDFLEKPYSLDELQHALSEGFSGLDEAERKSRSLQAGRRLDILSPREREVFEGVAQGKTNKEIAAAHGLSPRTVEAYRLQMMSKLGLRNLHDLLALSASARR